ncbi:AAA family ATPase [Pedobacter sp. AW1-32]|uniref:AAA family ATPase n=1 Tax=Pedobacter sp. AW1-32 TaxID=3383026 RepID=UPI003FEECA37
MNINDLIILDKEEVKLESIFLDETNQKMLGQLIREYRFAEELSRYKLPVNNKLLLYGASGCGKTMSAKAIAQKLGKRILILNLSNIISARLGETSQHLRLIFDKAIKENAVLFLDEFDQIGKTRGAENDSGEIRRLVNTLIQLIDYFPPTSLLICASNHAEILDEALLRRFQLRISFTMPEAEVLDKYYNSILEVFPEDLREISKVYDVSFAQAKDHALTQVKERLISALEREE